MMDIEILADRWEEEQAVLKTLEWPTPQPTFIQIDNLPF